MVTGVRTNTSLPRDKERGFDFVLSVIDISVTLEQICQRGVKEVWSHSKSCPGRKPESELCNR
jgi:hypothetical protein